MRALFSEGLREVPDAEARPGEALVRVTRAGVCSTDLEIVRGYMDHRGVLGHELAGVVVDHPDPDWIGARVVAEINAVCGRCDLCTGGMARHCGERTVMGIVGRDGCFAERVALPAANLHRVPDGVDDDRAVFAEPLAAAFEIVEQVAIDSDLRAAVLGDGRLGLLCAMVLAGAGCDPIVVGRHARKLDVARRAGLRVSRTEEPAEGAFDLVVEATGSPTGIDRATSLVRPRGTVVLKSTHHGGATIDTSRIVVNEVTLVGSRCGPFEPALRALADGTIDPTPMIDARFPLAEGSAALARAAEPGTLKVLIEP